MMGFGHNKIVRLFRELDEIGLIERKKQGQGRPARVYVKNFALPQKLSDAVACGETSEIGKSEINNVIAAEGEASKDGAVTSQMGKSALPQEGGQDFPKEAGNKPNWSVEDRLRWMEYYRERLRENIEYDALQTARPYDIERIDGYIELMAEACCTSKESVRINREGVAAELVRHRFLSLDREHILYVLDCMGKTTTLIGNIRAV